jgi:hypothetical protein
MLLCVRSLLMVLCSIVLNFHASLPYARREKERQVIGPRREKSSNKIIPSDISTFWPYLINNIINGE